MPTPFSKSHTRSSFLGNYCVQGSRELLIHSIFLVSVTNVITPKLWVTCHAVPQARLKAVVSMDQNSHVALAFTYMYETSSWGHWRKNTCCGYNVVLLHCGLGNFWPAGTFYWSHNYSQNMKLIEAEALKKKCVRTPWLIFGECDQLHDSWSKLPHLFFRISDVFRFRRCFPPTRSMTEKKPTQTVCVCTCLSACALWSSRSNRE